MKIFTDIKPYDCKECLFGLSEISCTILSIPINKDSYGFIEPLDNCPIRSIEDIEIKARVKRGFYSDDMLKINLVLDGTELASDEVVYKNYEGSDDD